MQYQCDPTGTTFSRESSILLEFRQTKKNKKTKETKEQKNNPNFFYSIIPKQIIFLNRFTNSFTNEGKGRRSYRACAGRPG